MEYSLKIKPCPFCGGRAKTAQARRPIGSWFVYCLKCEAATTAYEDDKGQEYGEIWDGEALYKRARRTGKQKAILAWNRRHEERAEIKTILIASSRAEKMIIEKGGTHESI